MKAMVKYSTSASPAAQNKLFIQRDPHMAEDPNAEVTLPRMGVDIAQIQKDLGAERPRVTEDIFVQRLLPLFVSKASPDVDIGVWMEYANTMTSSLDVIGPAGDIIFTAPPPLVSVVRLNQRGETSSQSLMQIVERAKLKGNVHPGLGENFLNNQLEALSLINEVTDTAEKQWVSIMQRYGYLPSSPEQKSETAAAANPQNSIFSDEDEDF